MSEGSTKKKYFALQMRSRKRAFECVAKGQLAANAAEHISIFHVRKKNTNDFSIRYYGIRLLHRLKCLSAYLLLPLVNGFRPNLFCLISDRMAKYDMMMCSAIDVATKMMKYYNGPRRFTASGIVYGVRVREPFTQ